MGLTAIREGVGTRLETISGLRVYDKISGTVAPPAAMVEPGDPVIDFDLAMQRGLDGYRLRVVLLISFKGDTQTTDALDGYLAQSGATSVKAAVEGDRTLGGAAADCRVVDATNYGEYTFGQQTYVGVTFNVEAWATGT